MGEIESNIEEEIWVWNKSKETERPASNIGIQMPSLNAILLQLYNIHIIVRTQAWRITLYFLQMHGIPIFIMHIYQTFLIGYFIGCLGCFQTLAIVINATENISCMLVSKLSDWTPMAKATASLSKTKNRTHTRLSYSFISIKIQNIIYSFEKLHAWLYSLQHLCDKQLIFWISLLSFYYCGGCNDQGHLYSLVLLTIHFLMLLRHLSFVVCIRNHKPYLGFSKDYSYGGSDSR